MASSSLYHTLAGWGRTSEVSSPPPSSLIMFLCRSERGDLVCTDTGHVISTRQGTKDRPLVHYGRDAGTDVIAASVASGLGGLGGGLVPHIVTCHLHRSKVEVNVDLGRRAVQERGQEAEFVHRLYHRSVSVISPTSPPLTSHLQMDL